MNIKESIGVLSNLIGMALLASTYFVTGLITPFVLIYLGMGMVYLSTIILLGDV